MWNPFAKPPTPEEMVRKWRSSLRAQERQLDRQIKNIEMEETKIKKELKNLAAKNNTKLCRTLARELVKSKQQKNRIITTKVQLNSVSMELQRQLSLKKISGSIQKSVHVMATVNNLVNVPELQSVMQQMSKEMIKSGIIEEMTEDVLDTLDESDLEEEVEEEVEKVLYEVTNGIIGKTPAISAGKQVQADQTSYDNADEEVLDLEEMRNRLSILKG
ncbi:hypothetical protein BB561_004634 [Smittium simulii]|uniref:Vacuolar protein-sorting-associated protein 24 n=1 Tax=Smittium simulii TaxID=133385 RepID=A0A2T9YF79_9FUNG|nr:hypothetical protein BB561_004634 [Smittium simulii]